jgi:hypothetical protein
MAESAPTAPTVEVPVALGAGNSSKPTSPIEPQPVIEADDDDDNDSAYNSNSLASSTTSIGSSILRYREENGRTYVRTISFFWPIFKEHSFMSCFKELRDKSQLSRY